MKHSIRTTQASASVLQFKLNWLHSYRLILALLIMAIAQAGAGQTVIGNQVDYAAPLNYRIAGITVSGAQYTDVQAIKLFSGLQEGDEVTIPGDAITDAVRKLWKQRLFTDIGIYAAEFRGNDVYLVISLKESPRMTKYVINGVKKSEADNLREKLDLRTMTISTDNVKNNSIKTIKDYYIDKGYYAAKIKVSEREDPTLQNGVILEFDVNKGDRVKIEEIIIEGAGIAQEKRDFLFLKGKKLSPVMSVSAIKRTMKDTKERDWSRVFKSSKFMEEKYEEDKQKVIAKYNKKGFRNAKIAYDSVYTINSERVGIYMKIEEDKRFYFRNINFVGNTKYTTGRLDSVLNIRRGDIYNLELLETRLNFNPQGIDLSSLYTDDGYLAFYAFPVETLIEPDSIDIEVRMNEGKQFRIGQIRVSGNTKTNDHVIFREVRTRPGELFNRSDIIRTQRELASLGYFNQEAFDVRTNPRPDEGLVDLEYVLEEKPNDQIQLSGGWGGGRVVGSLQLSFTNFSMRNFFKKESWSPLPTGDGQRLALSASSNGAFFQAYNISFTEPWLGGKKPTSLSVSSSISRQTNGQFKKLRQSDLDNNSFLRENYSVGDDNPNLQELKVIGGAINIGTRLQKPDDYFVLYTGISYQKFILNNYRAFFGDFSNGIANNLAYNFTLSRSSTSEPIYPTYGSQITFTTKLTPPYKFLAERFGDKTFDYENMSQGERFKLVEYYKMKITAHWYTALNKHKDRKFVLHTNVGLGFIGSYNKQLGLTPFERFYLGGVYLSGFLLDGREIVNLRGYDDLTLTSPNQNTGAPAIAKYSAELRYPLSTNPSATIFMMAFAEAGNTWSDLRLFNPYQVYRSAGTGLRIFLPMFGLLGFDYGWRLDDLPSYPNMARGQFHFSIGMNMGEL
jgi:outer membrane protein insertion porin family